MAQGDCAARGLLLVSDLVTGEECPGVGSLSASWTCCDDPTAAQAACVPEPIQWPVCMDRVQWAAELTAVCAASGRVLADHGMHGLCDGAPPAGEPATFWNGVALCCDPGVAMALPIGEPVVPPEESACFDLLLGDGERCSPGALLLEDAAAASDPPRHQRKPCSSTTTSSALLPTRCGMSRFRR